jgi:hypothetical protein
MTRHGLLIHAAVSHPRRPTRVLAQDKMKTACTRTNALSIIGRISAIVPANTFFNAVGSTNAAAIDGRSEASRHKIP